MGDEREGGAYGSPWAAPDEPARQQDPWAAPPAYDPYAPPRFYEQPSPYTPPTIWPPPPPPQENAPPPAQQQQAAPPAPPPYVPPPTAPPPYSMPYSSYAAPQRSPDGVTRRSARAGVDPWRIAGWRTGGGSSAVALRLLGALGVLSLLLTVFCAAGFAEERANAAEERRSYVAVDGYLTTTPTGGWEVVGVAPEIGEVRVPYADDYDLREGQGVELLVRRDDRTDVLLPDEQAEPGLALGATVLFGVLLAAAAGAAVVTHLRRRAYLDRVREVAARPPEGAEPPVRLTKDPPRNGLPLLAHAVAVVAFGLLAVVSGSAAANAVDRPAAATTVEGLVINGSTPDGRSTLVVRYYDDRQGGSNTRPLTDAEAAEHRFGDSMPVTYRTGEFTPKEGDVVGFGGYAALSALAALAVAWRAVAWRARLARARSEPARPVEVVAWTRVVRKRPWLVVAPKDATRASQVVAVPLVPGDVPAAICGTVYAHGAVRPGGALVLREPNGAPIWPAGPARGAMLAEMTFVPVGPPEPSGSVTGWR